MPTKASRHERDLEFRKQYEAGLSLSQIADQYPGKISPKGVSDAIKRVGGTMRLRGGDNKSKSSPFHNGQMKLPSAAETARMERDKKWREEYEAGATLYQLAARYSMSIHAIKRGVERAGGTMRPTGYSPQHKHSKNPRQGLLRWLNA